MARSAGLEARRGYQIDRELVLLGAVQAGARGEAAETRTGTARILTTPLDSQNVFKCVLFGQTSDVAGGYLVQAAHVAEGSITVADDYVTVGVIEGNGTTTVELPLSGKDIGVSVKEAADGGILTVDTLVGGSGYTGAGTYTDVPLTGGTGSGAQATIVVAGGAVTSVTITKRGKDYVVDDELSAANTNLGGAGSGFTVDVASVQLIEEPRAAAVRLVAGTGSNGAAVPAGTMTIALMPVE